MNEKFIDKRFNETGLRRIDEANVIIEEYGRKGFTLTLRQLYYQFVAKGEVFLELMEFPVVEGTRNNPKSYKVLGKVVNNGRLAGLIDWYAIEDRTRSIARPFGWSSPRSILQSAAKGYKRDRWQGQEYKVEVWIEKEALAGVIEPVCRRWDLTSFCCRGYVSQSVQWGAAKNIEKMNRFKDHQIPVILHLGDHDPSGIDMSRDIRDRLKLLSNDSPFEFYRIALNMDQIEEFNPPPNPAKLSDSRAREYIEKFGDSSWELDALQPEYIDELIEERALKFIDRATRQDILDTEELEREKIQAFADTWDDEGEDDEDV